MLSLYVTRQLIWKQMSKLFITIKLKLKYSPSIYLKHKNIYIKKSHKQDIV